MDPMMGMSPPGMLYPPGKHQSPPPKPAHTPTPHLTPPPPPHELGCVVGSRVGLRLGTRVYLLEKGICRKSLARANPCLVKAEARGSCVWKLL